MDTFPSLNCLIESSDTKVDALVSLVTSAIVKKDSGVQFKPYVTMYNLSNEDTTGFCYRRLDGSKGIPDIQPTITHTVVVVCKKKRRSKPMRENDLSVIMADAIAALDT